ncbi:MAG: leucyl aminopeptidase [Legionellales bacterium RIFCSPHIGHO2_12_FULL_42_9]|nr:MAG: leucyl aminopeptidase [Legionellales bacterium RIFCSPHIGHO2_12_FULL_42_9]
MDYVLSQSIETNKNDCIVVGFCNDTQFDHQLANCSPELIKQLTQLSKKIHEKGDWVWQTEINTPSVLLFHCGKQSEFDATALTQNLIDITPLIIKQKVKSVQISLPPLIANSPDWQIKQMLLQIDAQCYEFNDFKTTNKKNSALKTVDFCLPEASQEALNTGKATTEGVRLTRWLGDLPANHCTPTFLSLQAKNLAKQHSNITVTVFGRDEMQNLGMGALLAVAQGSIEPPRFIEISYTGANKQAPIVLVGKGVTFDAGGISLKPAPSMEEMKYDMCGAASVLGTIKVCALLNLPINVVGLIPSTENLPSGTAIKPGDVVTSLSGQTIEIINTDAEGRLILADALTYAERFKPSWVIDIATLTGAMVISLGYVTTGFMTADDQLAAIIAKASAESNDKAWRLPLDNAYQEALDSPVADMLNSTFDRSAGSITAACFLSRFTKNYRWAHLDIAGTAWVSGKNRQATGRPVPLLVELLLHVIHTR